MRGHLRRWIGVAALAGLLVPSAYAAPEAIVLGGEAGGDPVENCRALAASPFEADRAGTGLTDAQIFLNGAIAACEAALAAAPDDAAVQTWLGRAYLVAGRESEARALIESASAAGNPFALYLLSRILGGQLGGYYSEDVDRSTQLLTQAAEAGYPPAQADLGERMLLEGNGADALRLFEAASGGGVGSASYRVGEAYYEGVIVDYVAETAISFYELAVEQGEPRGHYGLGRIYDFGTFDIPQDQAKAASYYELGAEAGEKMSQTALAYLYEQGLGVEQDYNRSFALLVEAAAQDWGYAQAALSIHYIFGQGTEIDLTKGFDLAWAARRAGIVYANGIVGYLYQYGLGTVRDLPNALRSYQAGVDTGDEYSAGQLPIVEIELRCMELAGAPSEPGVWPGVPFDEIDAAAAIEACEAAIEANAHVGNKVWLARAHMAAGDYTSAVPALLEGSGEGNILAKFLLADLMLSGQGVVADPARAISLYEEAANVFVDAQLRLGTIYATGEGVPADIETALMWFRRAAETGSEAAEAQIAALTAIPDPNAIDLSGFGREGPAY